ncbi:hypothetical protein M885DRAFT_562950 [Pelagophyceae sp. CCMP2097]|nr:hypothetical protein M885DRAFT_562950 [Pelagophyceae sp. CCMP2097]
MPPGFGMGFRAEPPSDSGPSETLASKCIKVVIDNFAEFPVHENIPAKDLPKVTKGLSVDLDVNVAAEFIFDENY